MEYSWVTCPKCGKLAMANYKHRSYLGKRAHCSYFFIIKRSERRLKGGHQNLSDTGGNH
jgi:ribosomal protein S27AE